MTYKLGKLPPKQNARTLHLKNYISHDILPDPVRRVFREYKVPEQAKQMYGNERYGNCVWAMLANYIILTTCHTGSVVIPTLDDVLAGYSAVTGFNPGPPPINDNGTAMTDAFDYMRTTGMAGHKILAWAKIDHTDIRSRRLGVQLFGATCVGVQLPDNAEDQFDSGEPWEVDDAVPNPDSGHAILHPGYGSLGGDYVSWAKWDQKAGAEWESECIDEEYVLISDMWFDAVTNKTPGGLDLATLEKDLNAIAA